MISNTLISSYPTHTFNTPTHKNTHINTPTPEEGGNLTRSAAPDNTILGKRLGKDFRPVGQAIKTLSNQQLIEYEGYAPTNTHKQSHVRVRAHTCLRV